MVAEGLGSWKSLVAESLGNWTSVVAQRLIAERLVAERLVAERPWIHNDTDAIILYFKTNFLKTMS